MEIITNYLKHVCGAENVKMDEPLSRWTTFRVGGPAKYFVLVHDKAVLVRLVQALEYLEYPYFILGMGANVLASDQGYDGVIIKLNFKNITQNDVFVYADAGAKLGAVVNFARDHGLTGLEWATGIPATVGGGVFMNCGAFGGCLGDVTVMVDVLQKGLIKTLSQEQLNFGYRHSIFMEQPAVILGAYFRLTPGDKNAITTKMQEILTKRQRHPHEPSAGSVFKKPRENFFVGKVIEDLGLAGYAVGGAMVSPQHCNFIVNTGKATCADVLKIIQDLQKIVAEKTGVNLEPEIILL